MANYRAARSLMGKGNSERGSCGKKGAKKSALKKAKVSRQGFARNTCARATRRAARPRVSIVSSAAFRRTSVLVATTLLSDALRDQLIAYNGQMIWSIAGKRWLNGKTINTELTRSSVKQLAVGTKDHITVIEITADSCRLRGQDGQCP